MEKWLKITLIGGVILIVIIVISLFLFSKNDEDLSPNKLCFKNPLDIEGIFRLDASENFEKVMGVKKCTVEPLGVITNEFRAYCSEINSDSYYEDGNYKIDLQDINEKCQVPACIEDTDLLNVWRIRYKIKNIDGLIDREENKYIYLHPETGETLCEFNKISMRL